MTEGERWRLRAHALALELKDAKPTGPTQSAKERMRYRTASYALRCHLEAVPGDASAPPEIARQ